MKIQKYHYWLLFFFAIFGFTFGMIIWTVKSAVTTPLYEDKSFMSEYHIVDENFNQIMENNRKFKEKYETKVIINNKTFGIDIKDILYGRRFLKDKGINRDVLPVGKNKISISIKERETNNPVSNAKISFQITKAIEDIYDINIYSFKYQNGLYQEEFDIKVQGNWNIIGKIVIDNDIAYIYIKTSNIEKK